MLPVNEFCSVLNCEFFTICYIYYVIHIIIELQFVFEKYMYMYVLWMQAHIEAI